ncbi:MAG: hypothetical protein ACD_18C00204G0001 [uncultured bacterium]|nr:MAG: hypothetical protein ACD_18C00204G0001 [uncultured bacterium]
MALYHKYRPQTFADIIEQTHIVQTLSNQIKTEKMSHAYLFSGPRGVGKTTTARILAKSLNCTQRQAGSSEPCNTCQSCQEITSGYSIDVIEIDAASHTGVDNVRQNIIENSQFKPTTSKYKIFIIDEVHMLSTAAFNALLKTLEEPPAYVIFILATTDPQKLPATIISRCQRYTFTKVPDKEMIQTIKKMAKSEDFEIEEEVLKRIAKKSEGCVRDAISLLEQLTATGEKKINLDIASIILPTSNIEQQLEFTKYLIDKQQTESLIFINKIIEEGTNLSYFSEEFIEFLRFIMIALADFNLAEKELDLSSEQKKQIKDILEKISPQESIVLLDLAIKRNHEIKTAVLPQLPLEMLVVEWCNEKISQSKENTSSVTTNEVIEANNNKILPTETKITPIKVAEKTIENIPQISELTKKEEEIVLPTNIVEESTQAKQSNKPLSKELVEKNWSSIIKSLEAEAPSMTFILKMAKIEETKDNTVVLSVGYSFHKEKLLENTSKQRIENIFSEIIGQKIKIEVIEITDNANKTTTGTNANNLSDLAAALGGEVLSA